MGQFQMQFLNFGGAEAASECWKILDLTGLRLFGLQVDGVATLRLYFNHCPQGLQERILGFYFPVLSSTPAPMHPLQVLDPLENSARA